jgi:hypothetical protein
MRRHDWIFDMLSDLKDYAAENGLPDLACSVEAALAIARREAAGADGPINHDPARRARAH